MPDLPGRGLAGVTPVPAALGVGVFADCDCGTTTRLMFNPDDVTEIRELAFTCDGCQSVHWFRIGPLSALEDEDHGN